MQAIKRSVDVTIGISHSHVSVEIADADPHCASRHINQRAIGQLRSPSRIGVRYIRVFVASARQASWPMKIHRR
jgi:hypothetical protein